MAQYEELSKLAKEMDVQVEMIEKIWDRLSYLEERMLQLEATRGVSRSRSKKGGVPPTAPSNAGEVGGEAKAD